MLQPFRKIRKEFLVEGSLKKYLVYAVGEILLVVIGILLALQINNWNEDRKERRIEKEILVGIRNDILKDTIDINSNINGYQRVIKNNTLLLDHLLKKKMYDSTIAMKFLICASQDFKLALHSSHFEEAKLRGLDIIVNRDLQQNISRLYEFTYYILKLSENEGDPFKLLYPSMSKYIKINLHELPPMDSIRYQKEPITIDPESYSKLLLDKNLQYEIFLHVLNYNNVLEYDYLPVREEALKVVDLINKELEKFD